MCARVRVCVRACVCTCPNMRVLEAIVDECVTFTTGKEKLLAINFALAGRLLATSDA